MEPITFWKPFKTDRNKRLSNLQLGNCLIPLRRQTALMTALQIAPKTIRKKNFIWTLSMENKNDPIISTTLLHHHPPPTNSNFFGGRYVSWASLVAQLVKNLPAMQETCIRFLGEKVPLRRERLPTPVFWPGNSVDCIVHGVPKNWTGLSDLHFHFMANVQCLCLARRCHLYSVPVTKQKWNLVYILTCMLTVCSVSPVLVWK